MNIVPLDNRVLVREEEPHTETASGIVLVNPLHNYRRGTVVAVGRGRVLDSGATCPVEVRKGVRVLYRGGAGFKVETDEESLLLLDEFDILARVDDV